MNILYICADRGIPVRGHKGAAVHVRAICRAFTNAGHNVTLLTPQPGPTDGQAVAADLIEVPLPPLPPGTVNSATAREVQARAYPDTLLDFARRLVTQQPFDFIYERYSLWSDVGARLSRLTGLPLVLEVNAPLRAEASSHRTLADVETAVAIERTNFTTAHTLAVVSQPLADYVVANGADSARVLVLPNGVDPTHFHPAVHGGDIHHRYGIGGKRIIGFAGRVRPWHDIDTLLRAVACLRAADPAIHLLLVGQTPDDLPARLAELGLTDAVTLTGAVAHDEVALHLAAMDVAVSSHAPLADHYFSPLKLFEYLACGRPTVAADIGQPAQIIEPGETGLLYPPGDDAALAAQIATLLAQPDSAQEMGWRGAARVLHTHTWAQNAQAVVDRIAPPTPAAVPDGPQPLALPLLDAKMRNRLYNATRRDLARPLLAAALPEFGKKGTAQLTDVTEIAVFKYKPNRRCVLGYTLNGRDRRTGTPLTRRVIGKVFKDKRGKRLLALQQRLWADFGTNPSDGIRVPAGLGYAPRMRMMLQAWAPGQTLNELAATGSIGHLIAPTAQALAKLHATRAFDDARELLRPYTLQSELDNLAQFRRNLAADRPTDRDTVDALYAGLLAWAESLPSSDDLLPIHRDFYYSQVLYDGDDLTLIDFDLLAWGDPAIDVANFCAHLHFMGADFWGEMDALAAAADQFRTAYAAARPVDAGFWQRVAFYEAATFFRLLNVVAPRPGLAHLFPALVARTQACLQAALAEAVA